jgi:hypothetical protein
MPGEVFYVDVAGAQHLNPRLLDHFKQMEMVQVDSENNKKDDRS